jgi:hypothetical protein
LEAFPCKIVRYQPYPNQPTACARGRAIGEDGLEFIVKSDTQRSCVCATEWICHSIAQFINMPVPSCKVLQMADGTLVFGTAVLSPRLTDLEVSQILFAATANNEIVSPELGRVLSSTYSFDLFVGNPDRHEENYIFTKEAMPESTQSIARARPIDFDQATLGRIMKGGDVMIERALFGIPSEWLPQEGQDALLTWASGPGLGRRVTQIEQGLRDGTYL